MRQSPGSFHHTHKHEEHKEELQGALSQSFCKSNQHVLSQRVSFLFVLFGWKGLQIFMWASHFEANWLHFYVSHFFNKDTSMMWQAMLNLVIRGDQIEIIKNGFQARQAASGVGHFQSIHRVEKALTKKSKMLSNQERECSWMSTRCLTIESI